MTDKRLRFGMIGAGGIAQAYAEAFRNSDVARIVAVADTRSEAATALSEGIGCQSYNSYSGHGQEREAGRRCDLYSAGDPS